MTTTAERAALSEVLSKLREACEVPQQVWSAAQQWRNGNGPLAGWAPQTVAFHRALLRADIALDGRPALEPTDPETDLARSPANREEESLMNGPGPPTA